MKSTKPKFSPQAQNAFGWAISGMVGNGRFFYIGWWYTRSEAIRCHTEDKGASWKKCKARGDRAEKIIVAIRQMFHATPRKVGNT